MPRIQPVRGSELTDDVKAAFEQHVKDYNARITNMKSTLGHSLLSFDIYMQWYPLYEEVKKILGERLAPLFAYSISQSSDCPLCSTYFRKIIIDAGERPENLQLTADEKDLLGFGAAITKHHGNISDNIYNAVAKNYTAKQLVILIAFAGQMIATNIFNNVIETEIDEYLFQYRPVQNSL